MLVNNYYFYRGREEGIRTLDTLSCIYTFQAYSFNHSDTSLFPNAKVTKFFCTSQIFFCFFYEISPTILSSNLIFSVLEEIFFDNKIINFVIADSLVMSFPSMIPIFRNPSLASYLPIITLPPEHCVTFTICIPLPIAPSNAFKKSSFQFFPHWVWQQILLHYFQMHSTLHQYRIIRRSKSPKLLCINLRSAITPI